MFRLVLACFLISTVGCASMTSSIMNRSDHDVFTINSHKRQKGVPVTVRVPTHLKVQIQEEYFLRRNEDPSGNHKHYLPQAVTVDRPILSVDYGFDYEDKIFMVDLKRPAVGTIQTDIQIDPATQYFKAIQGKVVDNTLREIAQIVPQIPKVQTATTTSGTIGDDLIMDKRTVAFTRIDINAVDFEQQLEQFFDTHINNCNDCQVRQGDSALNGGSQKYFIGSQEHSEVEQPEFEVTAAK